MQFCAPLNPLKLLQKRLPGTLGACDEPTNSPCEPLRSALARMGPSKAERPHSQPHRKVPIAKVYPKLLRPTSSIIEHHETSDIEKYPLQTFWEILSYQYYIISIFIKLKKKSLILRLSWDSQHPLGGWPKGRRATWSPGPWRSKELWRLSTLSGEIHEIHVDFDFCRLGRLDFSTQLVAPAKLGDMGVLMAKVDNIDKVHHHISFHIFVLINCFFVVK